MLEAKWGLFGTSAEKSSKNPIDKENNLPEMSLDEINAEIDAYRAERDAKRK